MRPGSPPPTDEQLARRAAGPRDPAARDAQAAFQTLYDRYAPMLLAFLSGRGVAPSDLDEVQQDVWLRVWRALPEQFDGRHFRAWLFGIAGNLLVDRSRKKKPELHADLGMRPDPKAAPPDAGLLDRELQAQLGQCLVALGEPKASLVRGRLAGEEYAPLCDRLGMTLERGYKLFHEARQQLESSLNRAFQ